VQRRVWRLVDALVKAWLELAADPADPALARAMEESVAGWWRQADGEDTLTSAAHRDNRQEVFLDRFDVTYRIRWLQFLIRRLNQHDDDRSLDDASRDALDEFKEQAYGFMDRCYRLRRSEDMGEALVLELMNASARVPLPPDEAVALLRRLSDALDLDRLDLDLDGAFFGFYDKLGSEALREALIGDYLGFPVYDVLLLAPGSLEGGPDPLTPIRVERISPADARHFEGTFEGLRCRNFMGFVGFFNRSYREHDYLWGRLNAAERIVDLLVNAAGDVIDDPVAFKRKLFRTIVDRERRRLYRCDAVLDAIQRHLDEEDAAG